VIKEFSFMESLVYHMAFLHLQNHPKRKKHSIVSYFIQNNCAFKQFACITSITSENFVLNIKKLL